MQFISCLSPKGHRDDVRKRALRDRHLRRTAFPGTARQGRCGAVQVRVSYIVVVETLRYRSGNHAVMSLRVTWEVVV